MAVIAGALIGGGLLAGGGLISGGGSGRDMIAPGLNKYTSQQQSQRAYNALIEALYGANMPLYPDGKIYDARGVPSYTQNMQNLIGKGRDAAAGLTAEYNRGASNVRGAFGGMNQAISGARSGAMGRARSATDEVAGVYRNYGREAEGVAGTAYQRALANIDDSAASRRTRMGYNSADQMLRAGQQREAQYGYSRAMSDITQQRSQLVGGALERGRAQENALGRSYDSDRFAALAGRASAEQDLLQRGLQVRERAHTLPAGYMQALYSTQLNTRMLPEYLYPEMALRRTILGGQGPNNNESSNQMWGGIMQQLGGAALGYTFG